VHRGSECAIVVLYKPVPNGYRCEVIMRRFLSFLLVFFGACALGTGIAQAEGDNSISTSSPAAGEVIALAPTQIQLRFTLPVGGADAVAQMGLVLTCESRIINLGTPQLGPDGVTVSAALTQILENGNCRVEWSLPDGSSGSFTFVSNVQTTTTAPVDPGTTDTTVPVTPGPDGETEELRLGGPLGLVKWLAFFFVSALVGGLIFVKIAWPEGVEYGITERYFRIISIAAILTLVGQIILYTAQQSGGTIGGSLSPTSWGPAGETNEGRALLLRLVAVGGLTFFAWITERIFNEATIVLSTALLAFTILTFGFDRATGRAVILGIVIAVLHMAFVALWVGAVAIIWRVILHGPGDIDLVHALRGWYRIATPVSVGIIITGAIQVWRIDGISLINSGHGRVVLLKIALVVVMLFVNAAVRQFVVVGMRRANSLNQKVVYRLKRPVGLELSLSIVVLAASTWLLSMRPPYILLPDEGPRVEYAIVQDLEGADRFRVRLSITPGNVGENKVLVELFGPSRIQNFVVTFTPENPNFSGYTLNVPLTRPGAALITEDMGMRFLAPGLWNVSITGVTTIGELEPLTTQFIIADGTTVTTVPKQGLTTVPPVTTTVPETTIAPAATTIAPPASPTTTAPPSGS
jgi:putative copper export protein/methionine-rich copper-binding protein CopC